MKQINRTIPTYYFKINIPQWKYDKNQNILKYDRKSLFL